jgi:hypothetical protein
MCTPSDSTENPQVGVCNGPLKDGLLRHGRPKTTQRQCRGAKALHKLQFKPKMAP